MDLSGRLRFKSQVATLFRIAMLQFDHIRLHSFLSSESRFLDPNQFPKPSHLRQDRDPPRLVQKRMLLSLQPRTVSFRLLLVLI